MVKRKSVRGEFFGCANYPNCRGTRQISDDPSMMRTAKFDPIRMTGGSDEQEAIWKSMKDDDCHIVISAGPGTGKTFSLVQGVLRMPRSVNVKGVAFNKHIADEMSGKLGASGCSNARFTTCHSAGNAILRNRFRSFKVDSGKMRDIFERLSPEPQFDKAGWRRTLNLAARLAAYVKNYLIDYTDSNLYSKMERIADHHGIDFKTSEYRMSKYDKPLADLNAAVELLPRALDMCKAQAGIVIDYDDMVWLPIVMDLTFERCDMLIGDEQQDSNALQHEFMMRMGSGARIVVVGDPRQAIYGFRGAHTSSMDALTGALKSTLRGGREFPLTITRRCPKLHVMLAARLYPGHIRAMEDAPMGEILTVKPEEAAPMMKPGDLVLCRVNKEIMKCAYKLIKLGVRPHIKGRDFGKGILTFLNTLTERADKMFSNGACAGSPMQLLHDALGDYRREEMDRLMPLGDKAEGRIEQLNDKCDCMGEMIANASSAAELRQRITSLFGLDSDSDPKASDVVTLGTVHRTKGLEAARVFVLAPELIPHPAARKEWEMEQEKHLAWVASTRAKFDNAKGECGTLVFCGGVPPIFSEEAA
jgi:superfamily I DNA/RNA helicase